MRKAGRIAPPYFSNNLFNKHKLSILYILYPHREDKEKTHNDRTGKTEGS